MSLRDDTDRLYAVLLEAAKHRHLRPNIVFGQYGPECAWAAYERHQMLEAVNNLRNSRGVPGVHPAEIERREMRAVGHCDYARKFAFYCAELAQEGAA